MRLLLFFLAATAFAADLTVDPRELPRYPAVETKDALSTFQVRPGFHLELVAGEPLVASPIAISFDENGRMFVLEMRDYSEDRDVTPHLGRVRLLEDIDGDGRYEKATIFADNLPWPTGLIWANGGLFVVAVPDIIRFEDRDADGRAEKREVIFTGFHSEAPRLNVQALPNCFQWGPDNLIHLQTSVGGRGRLRRATEKTAEISSGDFVFDPLTYEWHTEAGGGQYGMSYDNRGRRFVCSNSDHLQTYVYDSRGKEKLSGLPPPRASIAADGPAAEVFRISPDEPWRVIRTRWRVSGKVKGAVEGGGRVSGYFTGATGTTVYRGDAFPPEYVGDTFTGDAGGNLVHHKRLRPNGASLLGERPPDEKNIEFVASRDTWFRPVNFANAPDGSLYVIDMYREVIEHPWSVPEEIKKHLDLTSGRDRGRIWRLAPDGFKPKPPPKLGAATTAELVAALESRNGWTRDTATRLLCERRDESAVPILEHTVSNALTPLGRLHALRVLHTMRRTSTAVLHALDDQDEAVRELAVRLTPSLGVKGLDKAIWAKLTALAERETAPRVQLELLFTLAHLEHKGRPEAIASIARRSAAEPWIRAAILAGPDAAAVFSLLAADHAFRAKPEAEALLAGLAKSIGARGNEDTGAVLRAAKRPKTSFALYASLSEGIVSRTGGRPSYGANEVYAEARGAMLDNAEPLARRVAAARLLAFDDPAEATPVLLLATQAEGASSLRTAAFASLARFPEDAARNDALLARWKTLDPSARIELTRFLAARPSSARQLLGAVEKGAVPAAEIGATEARLLQSSKDAQIAALANKLLAQPNAGTREEVLKQFEPALTAAGDKTKGHEIFTQRCAVCHRLRGEGTPFGPDLESAIPGGKEKLLTHIIDPNREVAPQFAAYTVELKDGAALAGILASETPSEIVLREPLGKETPLPREKIARLQTTGRSPMPEGLEAGLKPEDLANLLAFLEGK